MSVLENRISLSDSNWQKIKVFYEENASIPPDKDINVYPKSTTFRAVDLSYNVYALITALKYDADQHVLFFGSNRTLYKSNFITNTLDSVLFPTPITNISLSPEGQEVLCVGLIHPNDLKQGSLQLLDEKKSSPEPLIDSLRRPVHYISQDLDNDGIDEKIICEFGNNKGEISTFHLNNGVYKKNVLAHYAGARKVLGYDFDSNGYIDLIGQFSQGDEKVSIFYNNNFKFTEKVAARFPPVYGSSSFDTLDWNNDGFLDFYCVYGDNADYSIMLKEYHGFRIFQNDGKNNFTEVLFFPIYGATDGKALDFDRDGDIDFAIIARFADYKNAPQNAFIYLENNNGTLVPHTVEALPFGRWITIETGDYDQDGDKDIFLGSFILPTGEIGKNYKDYSSLIILQNQTN